MPNYIVLGKGKNIRLIRDRGYKTITRFPGWVFIASGFAKCVEDAKKNFNSLSAK